MITDNRSFGLDLMRAMAIILVMIDHGKFFLTPFYPILNNLKYFSFYGVELFFVLSGFLIGKQLLISFLHPNSFHVNYILRFWKRRWLRTLPNYFLILGVLFLVYQSDLLRIPVWKYLFFLQNFTRSIPDFYLVSWSLSIEEWFYLSFPVQLLILRSISSLKQKPILLILVIFLNIAACFIIRQINLETIQNWNTGLRQVVLFRLDSVLFGVLASYFYVKHRKTFEKVKTKALLMSAILIIFSIFTIYTSQSLVSVSGNLLFIIVDVGFALSLPFFTFLSAPGLTYIRKLVVHLSLTSYALYLVNYDLVLILLAEHFTSNGLYTGVLFLIAFGAISLILASIIYRYFELPILNYRNEKYPRQNLNVDE